MESKERAERFLTARTVLNQHGKEAKTAVAKATGVSASAIVDYEDPESAREARPENVQKLADHYGVNPAWLMGMSESWAVEDDIRGACDSLGLTAEAYRALKELTQDERRRKFVNEYLASEEFARMISLFAALERMEGEEDRSIDYLTAMQQAGGEPDLMLREREIMDMRIWKAGREAENVFRRVLEKMR